MGAIEPREPRATQLTAKMSGVVKDIGISNVTSGQSNIRIFQEDPAAYTAPSPATYTGLDLPLWRVLKKLNGPHITAYYPCEGSDPNGSLPLCHLSCLYGSIPGAMDQRVRLELGDNCIAVVCEANGKTLFYLKL